MLKKFLIILSLFVVMQSKEEFPEKFLGKKAASTGHISHYSFPTLTNDNYFQKITTFTLYKHYKTKKKTTNTKKKMIIIHIFTIFAKTQKQILLQL